MQTYWDLTEKERAQLSSDEVQKFADAELMLKGVLKVHPLQLTEVPEMPKPDLKLYVLKHGFYETSIGFENEAHAGDAINDGLYIGQEWINGQTVKVAHSFNGEGSVVAVQVYSEARFAQLRPAIEKAAAAKSANERAEREHEEAVKKQADALKGMWEDWHDCIAKHEKLGQVINTFRDYEKTAGDATTASKFLIKVFDRSTIAEAAEWFGIEIPVPDADVEAANPPQVHPTIAEGVAF